MKNVVSKAARNSRALYPLKRAAAASGAGWQKAGTTVIPPATSYNTPVRFRAKFGVTHGAVPGFMAMLA